MSLAYTCYLLNSFNDKQEGAQMSSQYLFCLQHLLFQYHKIITVESFRHVSAITLWNSQLQAAMEANTAYFKLKIG